VGRRLGQHFLFQRPVLDRIAEAACPEREPLCIEIGPGPGTLTEALLERAERLISIELDPALAEILRQRHESEPRFELIESDALQVDLTKFGPAVVCGNIPYYLTSPLIFQALGLGANLVRAVFLIQKEVAERLVARPGTRDYGYLSVAAQALCQVDQLFTVKPGAFRPPPRVDSAVVRLTPREAPLVEDHAAFLRFAAAAFRMKRKTLRNNLGTAEIPHAGMRAEQLSIAQLVEVMRALPAHA
jgi:16S rRNA (adenine1518-N6/adenine1519-N6)-dimethyltransferase